jgi:formylglycine-generating enzyme required for sulfatase activity
VDWLARKTGKTYRLLTEAEWEYAARAQTEPGPYPSYSFGNDERDLCRYGNGGDQTAKDRTAGFTSPIAPCDDGYAYTATARCGTRVSQKCGGRN